MALNQDRLKAAIKTAYTQAAAVSTDREDGLDVFAENLAKAIIDEIKQLTITYNSGLSAGTNTVIGNFINTLS